MVMKNALSQIYRNFLLAEVFGRENGFKEVYSVILAPKDNLSTQNEITALKRNLKNDVDAKVFEITLEDLIEHIRPFCDNEYFGNFLRIRKGHGQEESK